MERKIGVNERPRSLKPGKAIAMAICPISANIHKKVRSSIYRHVTSQVSLPSLQMFLALITQSSWPHSRPQCYSSKYIDLAKPKGRAPDYIS